MIIFVQVVRVDLVKELPDSTVDATGHLPDPLKLVSVLHLVGFSLKNRMLLDLYTLVLRSPVGAKKKMIIMIMILILIIMIILELKIMEMTIRRRIGSF